LALIDDFLEKIGHFWTLFRKMGWPNIAIRVPATYLEAGQNETK
jgi:hypothetical protein